MNIGSFVTVGSLDVALLVLLVLPGEYLRGGPLRVGVHVEAGAPLLSSSRTKRLSPKKRNNAEYLTAFDAI